MIHPERETIIVLDFGSQYSQLIARRVRELEVYCEMLPYNVPVERIEHLNPKGFILARADLEQTEKKLLRAGADKVVMPYLIGGQKMAHFVTRPAVSDFLDFAIGNREMGLEMGELLVDKNSRLNGLSLIDSGIRQEMDIIIVAIRKKDGSMAFNPSSQTRIEEGDTLISLGKREDVERLSAILNGK